MGWEGDGGAEDGFDSEILKIRFPSHVRLDLFGARRAHISAAVVMSQTQTPFCVFLHSVNTCH